MLKILGCLQRILLGCSWERTHPACGELETLSTLEACAPRNLCALSGREKKCSAGFQPAKGPVDTRRVIQAHMPARRRRYDFFSRSEEHTSELQSHHDLVCRLL